MEGEESRLGLAGAQKRHSAVRRVTFIDRAKPQSALLGPVLPGALSGPGG